MTTATSLELHAGELRLALRPDLGGCVAGLWHAGLPVLRSTEPLALERSRQSGCYPLAPYSNRLGFRRFRWLGHDHTTQPNFDGSPHSVHGVAWQRAWRVESADGHTAALALVHGGDADWPFAFTLDQRFELSPQSLRVSMRFVNTAPHAQPVGLGWHPYFPKRARSRLHAELTHRWESDPTTRLPTRRVAQSGLDGDVAHMDFDHVFDGWQGAARIRDEKFSLRLTSSLDRLVVYTPPAKDHFCVEPVSHVSNAIHMAQPLAHGLRALEPGQAFEAWMQLDVAPA
ncbi:aldose 1-epimerase [Azohydromonas sediminis]|uniref:aldose 1-epimerase n=1 Tax=Azohydromonas sediminis TaxID=2259674 RepID=UPI000E6513E8|nr:aldose 1-epimerase [Azohydromonas sediminis]